MKARMLLILLWQSTGLLCRQPYAVAGEKTISLKVGYPHSAHSLFTLLTEYAMGGRLRSGAHALEVQCTYFIRNTDADILEGLRRGTADMEL